MTMQTYSAPDRTGHFGKFGGRFVPETLMSALAELEKAYVAAVRRVVPGDAGGPAARLRRRAHAAVPGRAFDGPLRPRAGLPEARGPVPHRRPQDQQHGRPGAAGQGGRQDAGHRGNRRRAAWRGDGDGCRPHGPVVRRVHGHRRHGAAEDQRDANAASGRSRPAGQRRIEDAQGRDQRGPSRLGDERSRHLLRHRVGCRPASVSDDGARFSGGHRQGGSRRDAGKRESVARLPGRLRRRREQLRSACSSTSSART